MVNFYSGFIVAESAKRGRLRNEKRREFEQALPDKRAAEQALAKWEASHPMQPGTIHDVVDHIDHLVRIAGADHVGIGSDFDGVDMLPHQLEDVSTYPLITQEFLTRGYTPEQIGKIMGQNVLRAFREAERVARRLNDVE